MVRSDGSVKIIDFGFGKMVSESQNFDKSVSLNWWCDLPEEFSRQVYDFSTEVYFVGKLFEGFIRDNDIDQFKYKGMLAKMCERDQNSRVKRFSDVAKTIQSDLFLQIDFGDKEMVCYRRFSDSLENHITKIESGADYVDDVDRVVTALENAHRSFMLEEYVPDCATVIRCILRGSYYYRKKDFNVCIVRDFLNMMKSFSTEKRRIVLSNLHTRLDAIARYENTTDDNYLPF